jgi:hypothetical protein
VPEYTDFRPRWAHEGTAAYESLEDTPNLGLPPPSSPRLPTRIIPANGSGLSADVLGETILATQRILNFVGYEAVHGVPNRQVTSLRQLRGTNPIFELARLHVEPFEEGSFVIPARLTEEPAQIAVRGERRTYTSQNVLERFAAVMDGIAEQQDRFVTCLGTLQAIESLGRLLSQDASQIEYYPVGYPAAIRTPKRIIIDSRYIEIASSARLRRQNPQSRPESLVGLLVAVDLQKTRLKLRVGDQTVRGTFMDILRLQAVQGLNRQVEITGEVQYVRGAPVSIQAISINPAPA